MKCAIYLALGNSLEEIIPTQKEQKEAMTDFIKSKGWNISKEYKEKSQKEFFAKYEEMKKDSHSRQFDFLVIYSLRSFGRHPLSATELLEHIFLPAGIGFYIYDEGYDSSSYSYDENFKYLEEKKKCLINNYRMEGLKKHRLSRNYDQYGYLFQDTDFGKKVVVDTEVSEYVKTIFEQFANGVTRAGITKYLNDNHVENPTQHFVALGLTQRTVKTTRWTLSMVTNILKAEIYSGVYHQNFMGESVSIEAPVFVDPEVLKRVNAILKEESGRPNRYPGNGGENELSRMLFDKKTGNKIVSYDRSKTDDFCLRAVVAEKTTSRVYSEEKILFKDAIREAQRVLLQEHQCACIAQKFLSSSKGKKTIESYLEQFQNKRTDYIKEVIVLNHLEMNRQIENEDDSGGYADQITMLDNKIIELEADIKKLRSALVENNAWIKLFTQSDFKNDIKSLKFRKYVKRFECIDFKHFELIPQKKEERDLIPAEWRGEVVWQEKAEKMLNV